MPRVTEVGLRFRCRVIEREVLAHVDLERAGERGLDRGHAHLAIALRRMAVADRESAAFIVNGQVERRAGAKLLHVEVAAMRAWLDR
jgi:hypothetical protein